MPAKMPGLEGRAFYPPSALQPSSTSNHSEIECPSGHEPALGSDCHSAANGGELRATDDLSRLPRKHSFRVNSSARINPPLSCRESFPVFVMLRLSIQEETQFQEKLCFSGKVLLFLWRRTCPAPLAFPVCRTVTVRTGGWMYPGGRFRYERWKYLVKNVQREGKSSVSQRRTI